MGGQQFQEAVKSAEHAMALEQADKCVKAAQNCKDAELEYRAGQVIDRVQSQKQPMQLQPMADSGAYVPEAHVAVVEKSNGMDRATAEAMGSHVEIRSRRC